MRHQLFFLFSSFFCYHVNCNMWHYFQELAYEYADLGAGYLSREHTQLIHLAQELEIELYTLPISDYNAFYYRVRTPNVLLGRSEILSGLLSGLLSRMLPGILSRIHDRVLTKVLKGLNFFFFIFKALKSLNFRHFFKLRS